MKKTIVLILLLIPTLCFAGALQEKHRSVIAKKNVVASGTENIGQESDAGESAGFSNDYVYCVRMNETPAHDGTVNSITFTTHATGDATGHIYFSLYTNGSGKPGSLVTNSNVGPVNVNYNTGSFYDLTYTYSGTKPSVTSGTTYWVCINNDGTDTNTSYLVSAGTGTCSGTGFCSVVEANAHDNFPSDWSAITPDFSNDGYWFGKLYFTYGY